MIEVLESWWGDNAVAFLVGTALWCLSGAAAVRLARTPIAQQRLAEATVCGVWMWVALAVVATRSDAPATDPGSPGFSTGALSLAPMDGAVPVPVVVDPQAESLNFIWDAVPREQVPALGMGPASAVPIAPSIDWLGWLGAGLGLGAVLMLAYLLLAGLLLAALLWRCGPAPQAVLDLLGSLPLRSRGVRVRVCARSVRPFCCGLFRVYIVLPRTLVERAANGELRAVLLHEMAHVTQRDLRGQLVFALGMPLLFWNPAFWWIRRQARLSAELVADDIAVRHLDRSRYVRELIDLIEQSPTTREGGVVQLAVLGRETEFYRRMKMLIERKGRLSTRCSTIQTLARRVAVLLLAAGASLAWTAPSLEAQESKDAAARATPPAAARGSEATVQGTRVKAAAHQQMAQLSFGYKDHAAFGAFVTLLVEHNIQLMLLEASKGKGGTKASANLTVQSDDPNTVLQHLEASAAESGVELFAYKQAKPLARNGAPVAPATPTGPLVSFSFDDADIREVIDTFAQIAPASFVVAPEVQGTVTLRLREVPWRDGLDATVTALGFALVPRRAGILLITTPAAADRLAETDASRR